MMIIWALVLASTIALSSGQGNSECLRFKGSACCPKLRALDRVLKDIGSMPLYVTFLPKNDKSLNIDNICYTIFPLSNNPAAYVSYSSTVYSDGQNEIMSFIVSEPEPGVTSLGNGLCQFVATVIDNVQDCNMRIAQRCITYGDCSVVEAFDSPSGLIGTSEIRKPIAQTCLERVAIVAILHGLPSEEYYILPMRRPSRCVLNQVCSVLTAKQRFCQAVSAAFPNFNWEQKFF